MCRLLTTSALLLAIGCHGSTVAPAPDLSLGPPAPKSQVDLLFVLGDEASTSQYQGELTARFPQLLQILETHGATNPAWYHIGVVTPSLGIGSLARNDCPPGGDGAKLRALGATRSPSCQALTNGLQFLDYNQLLRDAGGAATTNAPAGQDVATTFACMAAVGDTGCAFQMPLEAAYRALHYPIPENAGFLRDGALLVVVFVADEDDCSAPTGAATLFDFSTAAVNLYGSMAQNRCPEFALMCGDPPMPLAPADSHGPLANCRPRTMAEGGQLYDLQKYTDFFSGPNGVKADPRDVILAQLAPPPAPVAVAPFACTAGAPPPDCFWVQPSCVAAQNSQFRGNPAVRLNAVVTAAATSQVTSSCDPSYQQAMLGLAALITARVQ